MHVCVVCIRERERERERERMRMRPYKIYLNNKLHSRVQKFTHTEWVYIIHRPEHARTGLIKLIFISHISKVTWTHTGYDSSPYCMLHHNKLTLLETPKPLEKANRSTFSVWT